MKHKRTDDESKYLDWLSQWPCYCCLSKWTAQNHQSIIGLSAEARAVTVLWSEAQCGRTQIAHVGIRGLGMKCPTWECMPLGVKHHARKFDGGGPESHHVIGRIWWETVGLDRDEVFATLHELYVRETGGAIGWTT
jgi:hypothetical protein